MNFILVLLIAFASQIPPQFEVASVKLHVQGAGPELGGISEMPPSGRVNIVNTTLRAVLRLRSDVDSFGNPGTSRH